MPATEHPGTPAGSSVIIPFCEAEAQRGEAPGLGPQSVSAAEPGAEICTWGSAHSSTQTAAEATYVGSTEFTLTPSHLPQPGWGLMMDTLRDVLPSPTTPLRFAGSPWKKSSGQNSTVGLAYTLLSGLGPSAVYKLWAEEMQSGFSPTHPLPAPISSISWARTEEVSRKRANGLGQPCSFE